MMGVIFVVLLWLAVFLVYLRRVRRRYWLHSLAVRDYHAHLLRCSICLGGGECKVKDALRKDVDALRGKL